MTSFEYHLLSCLEGRIPTILKKTVFSIGRWDLHLEAIRGSLLAKKLKKLESAVTTRVVLLNICGTATKILIRSKLFVDTFHPVDNPSGTFTIRFQSTKTQTSKIFKNGSAYSQHPAVSCLEITISRQDLRVLGEA